MTMPTNKNDRGAGTSAAVTPSNRKASVMSSVRDWDDLVERGRQLKIQEERIDAEAGNVRWQWGDLALEVAPMGRDGENTGVNDRLRAFAEEIDVSFESLRQYRNVANAWPAGMRIPAQPWACHQQLMGHEDREELISNPVDVRTGETMERWTFRAVQRLLGHKPSPHYRKPPTTTDEKVEAATELLKDPEVADAIYGVSDEPEQTAETPRPDVDPEVQRNLREAQIKARQQMADRVAKKSRTENTDTLDKISRELDATHYIGKARVSLGKSLDQIQELAERDELDRFRDHLSRRLDAVEVVVGWIRSYLSSGDTSFDAELEALLNEGGDR